MEHVRGLMTADYQEPDLIALAHLFLASNLFMKSVSFNCSLLLTAFSREATIQTDRQVCMIHQIAQSMLPIVADISFLT